MPRNGLLLGALQAFGLSGFICALPSALSTFMAAGQQHVNQNPQPRIVHLGAPARGPLSSNLVIALFDVSVSQLRRRWRKSGPSPEQGQPPERGRVAGRTPCPSRGIGAAPPLTR